jgi:hypothetical protein
MTTYTVSFDRGAWKITDPERTLCGYTTRSSAIEAAIIQAKKTGEGGQQAEVLVVAEGGRETVVWVHGTDDIGTLFGLR